MDEGRQKEKGGAMRDWETMAAAAVYLVIWFIVAFIGLSAEQRATKMRLDTFDAVAWLAVASIWPIWLPVWCLGRLLLKATLKYRGRDE